MDNRRAFQRVEQRQAIKVKMFSAPGAEKTQGRAFSCSSQDLSVGGIQFSSHRQVAVNAELHLQISLTRPARGFARKGRVVWVREENGGKSFRIGLFFTDHDPQTLIEWRKAVARLDAV
jgi:Tfp pilus assembly protein PilZ